MSFRSLLNNTTVADKILFGLLIIFSVTCMFFLKYFLPIHDDIRIDVDGKTAHLLHLDRNATVSVDGPQGKTSVEIKNRKVRVIASPCENKLCVLQGWVDNGVITCLPNKVVITIGTQNGDKNTVDAITG